MSTLYMYPDGPTSVCKPNLFLACNYSDITSTQNNIGITEDRISKVLITEDLL